MSFSYTLYIPGDSVVHRADARVKLLVLFLISLSVLMVKTWIGIGVFAVMTLAVLLAAKLPFGRLCKLSVPLLVLLVFIILCNAITFDVAQSASMQDVASGSLEEWAPIALWDNVGIDPGRLITTSMYALRIIVIFFASYAVSFTSTAESLVAAFSWVLAPLRKVKVPVDDVAMALSLAIRFIPLMAAEAQQIRHAQASRGARFEEGGPWRRVASWLVVLAPLVVGMFHRASKLGQAMESRCYGAGPRTSLEERRMAKSQIVSMGVSVLVCVALIVLL